VHQLENNMSLMKKVAIILREISLVANSTELLEAQKAILLKELRAEKDRILGQASLNLEGPGAGPGAGPGQEPAQTGQGGAKGAKGG